jgi:hypothetical protein
MGICLCKGQTKASKKVEEAPAVSTPPATIVMVRQPEHHHTTKEEMTQPAEEGREEEEGGVYRQGELLYSHGKVKVYEGQEQKTGYLWTIKCVCLSDEDIKKPEVISICREIVDYVKTKLFPLSHPYLVKYVYAHFDKQNKSKTSTDCRTRNWNRIHQEKPLQS